MSLEKNTTNARNSPHHSELPEQPSSRFINRVIHLKTTYWNRGYAIVLLGLIGLIFTSHQWTIHNKFHNFLKQQNKNDDYDYTVFYYVIVYAYFVGSILGGVLATVYPAHNIFGISVTIMSIDHLFDIISIRYLNALTYYILQFCIVMTMAVANTSFSSVWTYWVPLKKQSIRHVPIVLYRFIENGEYLHDTIGKLQDTHSSYTLTLFIGVIKLAWWVLWLYVINGNYSFRSLDRDLILFGGSTRTMVSDIPWKSIFTSKPFLAIALLYVIDAQLLKSYDLNVKERGLERTMINYTIILLLLFVVLVELFPEITVSISTSIVRKFWSCLNFGSIGIILILVAISKYYKNAIRFKNVWTLLFKKMLYLNLFGFYVNSLDIALKYASLLDGLLNGIFIISYMFPTYYVKLIEVESEILMAIICFAAAILYAIFASAEIQPWATDEPEDKNQQNMVKNDDKL